jgi:hypothetical protein
VHFVDEEVIWLNVHLQICFLWRVRTVHGERSEMLAPAGAKALTPAVIPAITSAAYFMLCLRRSTTTTNHQQKVVQNERESAYPRFI